MLLENKADPWLRDEDGAKPTKLARKGGHRGTRQVISRYKPPKEERLSPVRRVLLQVGLVRTFASEAELVEADAPVDAGAPVDTMEATEPAGADSAPPPAAEPQGDPPADWLDAAPADGADATTEE